MSTDKNKGREFKDSPSSAVIMRVFKRDKFTCQYCGIAGNDAELQCDHIIPVAKGGSNHISNLATACRKCNQSKGDRSVRPKSFISNNSGGMVGHWLHYIKDEKIKGQGVIIGIEGEYAVIQFYDWLVANPSTVQGVKLQDLFDVDKFIIYSKEDEDGYLMKKNRERNQEWGGFMATPYKI